MPYRVLLNITNYRYSIGGEHYYGKLSVAHKSELYISDSGGMGSRSSSTEWKNLPEDVELKRKIDKEEAEYLNEKDGSINMGLKEGDETIRFRTEEEVIDAAKKAFREFFDKDADCLVEDDGPYCEPDIMFDGPTELVERYNAMEYEEQVDLMYRLGYTCSNPEIFEEVNQ